MDTDERPAAPVPINVIGLASTPTFASVSVRVPIAETPVAATTSLNWLSASDVACLCTVTMVLALVALTTLAESTKAALTVCGPTAVEPYT